MTKGLSSICHLSLHDIGGLYKESEILKISRKIPPSFLACFDRAITKAFQHETTGERVRNQSEETFVNFDCLLRPDNSHRSLLIAEY